jgi:hypothetical protein
MVKRYWETSADNLQQSRIHLERYHKHRIRGAHIVVVDAHRDGKRFVVRADEKLAAFLELAWSI